MKSRLGSICLCIFSFAASAFAVTDHVLTEFPRLAGESDDTPRFQRAVDACYGGGLLTVPSGDYEFASTLYVTNLCSVRLSPAAIVRAVKPMKWMVEIDCTWEYQKKKAPKDVYSHNFNLSWSGGILDGCGLASCLALDNFAHFILENATFNNGRIYGVGVETHGRGYELIARNLYFHTSMPGLEGNTGLYTYGGDSHFIDIISVNYTIGIHLAGRGSNRMSRCHVWGVSTRPLIKDQVPETLKESVCFKIDATDTVMRDCYADTGNIGFWMNGWEERMECCSYAGLKLLKDSVVIRQNRGSIWANGFYARKISKDSVLYAYANEDSRIRWGDDCLLGPFGGPPKGDMKEYTAEWAKKTWASMTVDASNAAQVLIAACDRWETTCEQEASDAGRNAWKTLSGLSVGRVASDPVALFAVWRFCWSTLSRPGEERKTAERILVECAKFLEPKKNVGSLVRTATFSAAYDVTGESRWRAAELAVADAGISEAGKVWMNGLSDAKARERKLLLRLLRCTEKDAVRKDRYGQLLGEEAARITVTEKEGDIGCLMDYWFKRRHALFITTQSK